jgi:hypothetical protein
MSMSGVALTGVALTGVALAEVALAEIALAVEALTGGVEAAASSWLRMGDLGESFRESHQPAGPEAEPRAGEGYGIPRGASSRTSKRFVFAFSPLFSFPIDLEPLSRRCYTPDPFEGCFPS